MIANLIHSLHPHYRSSKIYFVISTQVLVIVEAYLSRLAGINYEVV
jgi:hypothetical protein